MVRPPKPWSMLATSESRFSIPMFVPTSSRWKGILLRMLFTQFGHFFKLLAIKEFETDPVNAMWNMWKKHQKEGMFWMRWEMANKGCIVVVFVDFSILFGCCCLYCHSICCHCHCPALLLFENRGNVSNTDIRKCYRTFSMNLVFVGDHDTLHYLFNHPDVQGK